MGRGKLRLIWRLDGRTTPKEEKVKTSSIGAVLFQLFLVVAILAVAVMPVSAQSPTVPLWLSNSIKIVSQWEGVAYNFKYTGSFNAHMKWITEAGHWAKVLGATGLIQTKFSAGWSWAVWRIVPAFFIVPAQQYIYPQPRGIGPDGRPIKVKS